MGRRNTSHCNFESCVTHGARIGCRPQQCSENDESRLTGVILNLYRNWFHNVETDDDFHNIVDGFPELRRFYEVLERVIERTSIQPGVAATPSTTASCESPHSLNECDNANDVEAITFRPIKETPLNEMVVIEGRCYNKEAFREWIKRPHGETDPFHRNLRHSKHDYQLACAGQLSGPFVRLHHVGLTYIMWRLMSKVELPPMFPPYERKAWSYEVIAGPITEFRVAIVEPDDEGHETHHPMCEVHAELPKPYADSVCSILVRFFELVNYTFHQKVWPIVVNEKFIPPHQQTRGVGAVPACDTLEACIGGSCTARRCLDRLPWVKELGRALQLFWGRLKFDDIDDDRAQNTLVRFPQLGTLYDVLSLDPNVHPHAIGLTKILWYLLAPRRPGDVLDLSLEEPAGLVNNAPHIYIMGAIGDRAYELLCRATEESSHTAVAAVGRLLRLMQETT